jgi:hypothetical protein
MNRYRTETNVSLIDTTPMFASVWLALFNQLRKNFEERRLVISANKEDTTLMGEK